MKTEWWVVLAVVAFVFFSRMSTSGTFTGLQNQRGPFGTPATPVDNSVCCS